MLPETTCSFKKTKDKTFLRRGKMMQDHYLDKQKLLIWHDSFYVPFIPILELIPTVLKQSFYCLLFVLSYKLISHLKSQSFFKIYFAVFLC